MRENILPVMTLDFLYIAMSLILVVLYISDPKFDIILLPLAIRCIALKHKYIDYMNIYGYAYPK